MLKGLLIALVILVILSLFFTYASLWVASDEDDRMEERNHKNLD